MQPLKGIFLSLLATSPIKMNRSLKPDESQGFLSGKISKVLALGILSATMPLLVEIQPSTAQICNPYGCSQPGAGACNPYGCPSPGAEPCNPYGCPNPGAESCNPYGCPASPQNSKPPARSPASDRRNFVVYNGNNQPITGLYVVSTNSDSWGRNILSNVLGSGSSTTVTFSNNSELCIYEVKAVYGDQTYDRERFNLCKISTVEFTGNGGNYAPR